MQRIVLTGGPGAGKTALLAELATMGYTTVQESARAIIAERLASGRSRRPSPLDFAKEVLRRDIEKYLSARQTSEWVFFDRGVLDGLGLLQEVSPLPSIELHTMLSTYRYHNPVFILPPWKAIYANDAERDQTFAQAVAIHAGLERWYHSCGYIVHEIPRASISERARYVLRVLAERQA
jgi:predicted ATPase